MSGVHYYTISPGRLFAYTILFPFLHVVPKSDKKVTMKWNAFWITFSAFHISPPVWFTQETNLFTNHLTWVSEIIAFIKLFVSFIPKKKLQRPTQWNVSRTLYYSTLYGLCTQVYYKQLCIITIIIIIRNLLLLLLALFCFTFSYIHKQQNPQLIWFLHYSCYILFPVFNMKAFL